MSLSPEQTAPTKRCDKREDRNPVNLSLFISSNVVPDECFLSTQALDMVPYATSSSLSGLRYHEEAERSALSNWVPE